MSKENKKIFVVYKQQRWDQVSLIKGYESEKEAEKLRKSLEEKEECYEEIYCVREVEIDLDFLVKEIGQLKRYSQVWDWLEEHKFGEYVKYDDVISLFTNEISKGVK